MRTIKKLSTSAILKEYQKESANLSFAELDNAKKEIKDKQSNFFYFGREDLSDIVWAHNKSIKLSSKDYKQIAPKRFVGVEIELSRGGLHHLKTSDWETLASYCSAVKNDASVLGDGLELNTIPSRGSAFHQQMEKVGKSLKNLKAKADKSCGLHVHVDASDFKGIDIFKTLLVWGGIQDIIYKTLPQKRRTTSYAKPFPQDFINRVVGSRHRIRDETALSVINRFRLNDRYTGLNFRAWSTNRPTLEFRLHEGTANGMEITLWSMLCAEIISFAKKSTISDIRGKTGEQLIAGICKDLPFLLKYIERRTAKYNKET